MNRMENDGSSKISLCSCHSFGSDSASAGGPPPSTVTRETPGYV